MNMTRPLVEKYPNWRGCSLAHLYESVPLQLDAIEDLHGLCEFADFSSPYTVFYPTWEECSFLAFTEENRLQLSDLEGVYGAIDEFSYRQILVAMIHIFTYERMLAGLSGEDMLNANGIPYLWESYTDLESSVFLFASGRYLKQSMQSLRTAVETAVSHSYFSLDDVRYEDLSMLKIPSMSSTKTGMLARLHESGFIDLELKETIAFLFRSLSKATHSQFQHINVKYEDEKITDRLCLWASCAAECAVISLKLALQVLRYDVPITNKAY